MYHHNVGKICEAMTRADVDKQGLQLSSLLPHMPRSNRLGSFLAGSHHSLLRPPRRIVRVTRDGLSRLFAIQIHLDSSEGPYLAFPKDQN
jgi:hypothetical protein